MLMLFSLYVVQSRQPYAPNSRSSQYVTGSRPETARAFTLNMRMLTKSGFVLPYYSRQKGDRILLTPKAVSSKPGLMIAQTPNPKHGPGPHDSVVQVHLCQLQAFGIAPQLHAANHKLFQILGDYRCSGLRLRVM